MTRSNPSNLQEDASNIDRIPASSREGVLRILADSCRRAAEGDFEVRVPTLGDDPALADVRNSVNLLLDRTDAMLRESAACLVAAGAGRFHRRFLVRGMAGSFRFTAAAINEASSAMAASSGASKTAALELSNTATQLGASSDALVETTSAGDEQSSSVASATEEMNIAIGEIAKLTAEAASLSAEAGETAQRSMTSIDRLRSSSDRIGGVVQMISKIASQTRLLALNAAIEAARAGEHGRGFSIVANEVKSLAQETADATSKVELMVDAIQSESRASAEDILTVSELTAQIGTSQSTIAAAVEEQLAVSTEIAKNIAGVAANAGTTREVADTLSDLATKLFSQSQEALALLADAE